MFSEQGDAQASETVLRGITPGDNPGETVELHFGAGEDQILNLPGGRASLIMLEGVATDGGDHASFRQSFLVWRDSRHPIGHPSGINIVAHGAQENLYSPGAVSWTLVPNVVGSYWLRWFGIVFCTGVTTKKVHVVCNVRIVETTWRT
jgi:hypothetical protein